MMNRSDVMLAVNGSLSPLIKAGRDPEMSLDEWCELVETLWPVLCVGLEKMGCIMLQTEAGYAIINPAHPSPRPDAWDRTVS